MSGKRGRPLDVAIVGMACRFPGARDLVAFWSNILQGRDATRDVPSDRWDSAVFFDPDSTANDRVYCHRGGFLDEPVEFDPSAFGIMPLVVEGGEPEQFLVLDAARAALVDAGMPNGVPDGRCTEVVIGRGNYFNRGNLTRLQHGRIVAQTLALLRSLHPEWSEADFEAVRADLKASLPPFEGATIAGQVTNATAGVVANRLNLHGASYVIDAASASSLVALQQGARALVDRRADVALVGGVYLAVDVDFSMVFCQLGALSRGGVARPFAQDADGTLPGEGVGMVVLKRRADAEQDGDRIYAVVQGVGVASDGRGTSLAAPSAKGHARAIRRAYRASGIDPATVGLIEGHGLGVPASDRAELKALRAVFPTSDRVPRALGAVSSMIGHAMPAAGIAGLIKTALALHHRVLPPTLHAGEANPLLAAEPQRFRLNRSTRPWIHGVSEHPRRAGVNAFGFAGINTHALLEEHSASADGLTPGGLPHWESEAILLGAPDRAAWLLVARALADWLERGSNQAVALKDLAYTLNCGQPAYPFRVGFVVSSVTDLRERLDAVIARLSDSKCKSIRDARGTYFWEDSLGKPGAVAFLFPGEGSQYPRMLADLCPHFPEIRKLFDTSDRLAREQNQPKLPSEVLFADGPETQGDLWAMETATNVVLSAQWALRELLTGLGIRPDAVLGHSSGEFLALAAAGVFQVGRQFEDDLGRLCSVFEHRAGQGEIPEAILLAVAADRARVERVCGEVAPELSIAMDNCPHQVVVCGPPDAAEKAAERLRAEGILFEALPFARAYHTPAFAVALEPIQRFFAGQPVRPPAVPVYSCATADAMPFESEAIRRLGVEQWVLPVEFRKTIEAMHAAGTRVFVEVGTRGNLTGFVEDTLRGRPHFAVAANLPKRSGLTQLNHLVASLFAQGVPLRADLLYARRRPARVDLGHDLPSEQPKPALKVGFPEMRLSESLAARLQARVRVQQNGHAPHANLAENGTLPHHADPIPRGPIPGGADRERAMLSYLETMNAFLDTQREVLRAYTGGSSVADGLAHAGHVAANARDHANGNGYHAAEPAPVETEPRQVETQTAVAEDPPVAPPAAPSVRRVSRADALVEQVAQRTGYPREMLDLDLDIEGDLGIDSIKRVEILGELQNKGLVPESADLDKLSRCRTLRQVIDLLGEPAAPAEARPVPGPWVGTIEHWVAGRELRATRWLDLRTDPVAEHHTIGGRRVSALDRDRKGLPVLPFTVMAEMIAQAGALLVPERLVVSLRDVEARRWIRYEEEPFPLELRAERDPARPDEVRVAIFGKTQTGKSRRAAIETPLVEGTVVFGPQRAPGPPAPPFHLREPRRCRFTAHELYADQWLFHGPALQAVVRVGTASPEGIEGTLRVLPRAALFPDSDDPSVITDPIVLDAFTHLLGCWGLDEYGDGEGDVIFPLRLAELTLYELEPAEGADVECRIKIQDVGRHRVRVDADFVTADGRLWMRLKDWEDWRFYWPGRYRDQFRAPDRFFLGEPLALPGAESTVCAVWLEPPADMTRPVWRDVLEWVQLEPNERRRCRQRGGPDASFTHRLFGRIAAKEAVRRLWADQGAGVVYPGDLVIDADSRGKPYVRSLLEPERKGLPAVSLTHTEGVALALAALDPETRVGIDVERIVEREAGFEEIAFTDDERRWLDAVAEADRSEWIARFWCAKEAGAKATGFALLAGPASVQVVSADRRSGAVNVVLGPDLANACRDWDERPIQTFTARRGEYAWAWTLGRRTER